MKKRYRVPIAVCALVLSAAPATAKDWCFNSTSPPNPAPIDNPDILVFAQSFSLPKKGRCKNVAGWDSATTNGFVPRPVTGTVCLNFSETLLRASFTLHGTFTLPSGNDYRTPMLVWMELPYPSLTNGLVGFRGGEGFQDGDQRQDGLAGPCGSQILMP